MGLETLTGAIFLFFILSPSLLEGLSTLRPGLVKSATTDVPHPLDYIVVTVVELRLKYFQVADLQTRGCKRNLEGRNGIRRWKSFYVFFTKNLKAFKTLVDFVVKVNTPEQ